MDDKRQRPPPDFNMEHVLQNIAIDSNLFVNYLQENYLHFFSDIEEAADTCSVLSSADLMAGFKTSSMNDSLLVNNVRFFNDS
jgi:hypothetical protein